MIIRLYYHKIELIKESCNFRSCFTANCHRLSCTFINFELVQILMRVLATRAVISSQLSCSSCSHLTGAGELRKFSCKLSLLNSHQLSCNSCSRLTRAWELRKLWCKLSLLNSHATLVLVWPGNESWLKTLATQLSFSFEQNFNMLLSFDILK